VDREGAGADEFYGTLGGRSRNGWGSLRWSRWIKHRTAMPLGVSCGHGAKRCLIGRTRSVKTKRVR
jgi:hypothetical protein